MSRGDFKGWSGKVVDWLYHWRKLDEKLTGVPQDPDIIPSLDRQYEQVIQTLSIGENRFCSENEVSALLCKSYNGLQLFDSLMATKLYFSEEWDVVLEDYFSWRAAMESCYLVMRNKKVGDKKGIVAQCQTRFSDRKRKETRWRMEQFSNRVMKGGFRFGLEITTTTDPKRFSSLKQVGDKTKVFNKKFLNFARNRINRAGKKAKYLKALELTDSGLLHTHNCFFGKGLTGKCVVVKRGENKGELDYVFPKRDISKLWDKYGIGEVSWVKKKPIQDCVDYVTKHVSKGWGGEADDMLNAFLHFTGMRQWSASESSIPKLPASVESWDLVALAFSPGEALIHRENLISKGVRLIKDDLDEVYVPGAEAIYLAGSGATSGG